MSELTPYEKGLAGQQADIGNTRGHQEGREMRLRTTALDGSSLILLLASPFLALVYPAMGLTALAIFFPILGGTYWLGHMVNVPGWLVAIAALVTLFAILFYGPAVEERASQFGPYRWFRSIWRLIAMPTVFIYYWQSTHASFMHPNPRLADVSTDVMVGAGLLTLGLFLLLKRADRIYFSVDTHVAKLYAMAEAGIKPKRPFAMRVVYSLLWIIPVIAVVNLGVGLVERGFVDDPRERRAFNEQYQSPIYAVAGVSWLLLSVFGILPGTGRFKRNPLENEVKEAQLVASVRQSQKR